MVEVDADCEHRDGVTLVRARVRNTRRTAQRVILASQVTPVWPPRRGPLGSPAWDDDTWTGTVGPDRVRGVGFASPAEPSGEAPVELVGAEPAEDDRQDPLAVLASLEASEPPADARDA